jgi:hypothetical protein
VSPAGASRARPPFQDLRAQPRFERTAPTSTTTSSNIEIFSSSRCRICDEVWSGRGRMPLWLGAELKAGKEREVKPDYAKWMLDDPRVRTLLPWRGRDTELLFAKQPDKQAVAISAVPVSMGFKR